MPGIRVVDIGDARLEIDRAITMPSNEPPGQAVFDRRRRAFPWVLSGALGVVAGLALGVVESVVTNLFIPAFKLGGLSVPRLGPAPGMHDVLALLLLVLALALLPGLLRIAVEPPE